jgi:hypothetical protein
MAVTERASDSGTPEYEVEFHEHRLEDIMARINRFKRADEKPFEAVAAVSEFNQRAYELFARPMVQAMATEQGAEMLRNFHPLRFQNWAISSMNPWLSWIAPTAQTVKSNRKPMNADHPLLRSEKLGAELVSASLDLYRAMRDAMTEAQFFGLYANMVPPTSAEEAPVTSIRDLPQVREAVAAIAQGGYDEAVARAAFLLARKGETLPLSRVEMRQELATEYADYLPHIPPHQWRAIRGVQEIIARTEPDKAVSTLPELLEDPADRERFLTLLDKVSVDRRVLKSAPTAEQAAMAARIRALLEGPGKGAGGGRSVVVQGQFSKQPARKAPARKKASK